MKDARPGRARRRRSKRARCDQLSFDRMRWGGERPGAGRKKVRGSGVSHRRRELLAPRFPVHVTLRLRAGLCSLRRGAAYHALRIAFGRGRERGGFRLVHYAVQSNHLHLIVEAKDRESLSRGMQGLAIRVARALNRLWERGGSVFADRYHDRILRSPRQVRNALCYVLCNASKHGLQLEPGMPDPFTSGDLFDGWRERPAEEPEVVAAGVVARARTWLATKGWRRHGLLSFSEVPGRS